jgi:RHS repeat-associated protein
MKQNGNTFASFQYDAFDRRIQKTIGGKTTTYLYDGDDPIQETQGTDIRPILTGLAIDERFARDETAGRRYFLTDALGSTIALTDETGTITQTYAYEPYGETTATGTSDNPYQYTGRENDGTGLYYYRARYYSPGLKRFVSEDPLGLAAGLNAYAYVGGNPLGFVDPLGLSERDVQKIIDTFDRVVNEMNERGERLPTTGTFGGIINNNLSGTNGWEILRDLTGRNTLICGEQWDRVHLELIKLKPNLDADWNFRDIHTLGHLFGEGTSSDGDDPVLHLDPWKNRVTFHGPHIWSL